MADRCQKTLSPVANFGRLWYIYPSSVTLLQTRPVTNSIYVYTRLRYPPELFRIRAYTGVPGRITSISTCTKYTANSSTLTGTAETRAAQTAIRADGCRLEARAQRRLLIGCVRRRLGSKAVTSAPRSASPGAYIGRGVLWRFAKSTPRAAFFRRPAPNVESPFETFRSSFVSCTRLDLIFSDPLFKR